MVVNVVVVIVVVVYDLRSGHRRTALRVRPTKSSAAVEAFQVVQDHDYDYDYVYDHVHVHVHVHVGKKARERSFAGDSVYCSA